MSDASDAKADTKTDRFSTAVTVLIALVSTVIALVASQAAVASGDSAEAQHNGVLAKINLERVDGGTWAEVARNRRAFNTYRLNRNLYNLTFDYINKAEANGASPQGTRLRLEAAGALEESNLAFQFIDSGYLVPDDQGQYVEFDQANFANDRRQTAAIYEDIDYTDNFGDADRLRTQSLGLNISLVVWFVSLMFITWAQITKSLLRWVWLGAGLLLAVAIVVGYVLTGVLNALGLG